MTENRLAAETSPYLLQHKDNPVHWRAWGRDAFDEARRDGKPVLLSVGYAACHWCHVMAHESFEDEAIAGLMNDLFVNIKVDREERPDVDTIYQSALQMLGEHGGWPLTMFLTPDGEPFWGGTYFPPEPRFGRPGFPQVLQGIAEVYRSEPDKIAGNVTALKDAFAKLGPPDSAGGIPPEAAVEVAGKLLGIIDIVHGGVGQAPKFPQVPLLHLLWRAWHETGKQPFHEAVTVTLDRMSQGGIYDHLGGGFARYATDAKWLVPHFEKMLYDNAQMVDLLTLVWQETKSPLYAERVRETVDWLRREMVVEGGGFAGTLDADSEGEEGKFYVWSEDEIDRVLGDESALFKRHYDVSAGGNWEGKTILNRSERPRREDEATEKQLEMLRGKLLKERDKRIRPGLDDKVLADWNGLMVAALARAGDVFGEPDWIAAAARAYDFVREKMTADGRLLHAWRAGRAAHPATLDDYAAMVRAAVALHQATGEAAYLDHARAWVDDVDAHFHDAAAGGYFFSADDVDDLITRTKNAHDSSTPAGNAVLAEALVRLFHLTGEDRYRARAEEIFAAFSGELERNIFPLTTLLAARLLMEHPLQVVVVGHRGEADTDALIAAINDRSLPDLILQVVAPEDELPAGHPARGKGQVEGTATAYVCRGPVCSLPATDAVALAARLDEE